MFNLLTCWILRRNSTVENIARLTWWNNSKYSPRLWPHQFLRYVSVELLIVWKDASTKHTSSLRHISLSFWIYLYSTFQFRNYLVGIPAFWKISINSGPVGNLPVWSLLKTTAPSSAISKAPVVMKLCTNVGKTKNKNIKVCIGYCFAVLYQVGGLFTKGIKDQSLSPMNRKAIARRWMYESKFIAWIANFGGG